jgi:hypothetical protein
MWGIPYFLQKVVTFGVFLEDGVDDYTLTIEIIFEVDL